jgi:hypothetical protein
MLDIEYNYDFVAAVHAMYCKRLPKPLSKQKFAGLLGAEKYTDLRKQLDKDKSLADFLQNDVSPTDKKSLEIAFAVAKVTTQRELSVGTLLEALLAVDEVTRFDFDDYRAHGLSKKSPISLTSIIFDYFLKYPNRINLTSQEAKFLIQTRPNSISFPIKLELMHKHGLFNLVDDPYFAILFKEIQMALEDGTVTLSQYGRSMLTIDAYKALVKRAFENSVITLAETAEILRSRFDRKISTEASEGKLLYKVLSFLGPGNSDSQDDIDAITFFFKACVPKGTIKQESRNTFTDPYSFLTSRFDHDPDPNHNNIDAILKSKSLLASPVLATYLLNNFTNPGFSLERFYACLYVIMRVPELKQFVALVEPLLQIQLTHKYTETNLRNSIHAAFLLTQKAKTLNISGQHMKSYIGFLSDLLEGEQYELLLAEVTRFIQFLGVSTANAGYTRIFEISLKRITDYYLKSLSQKVLNACYIYGKRFDVNVNRLHELVSEEHIQLCEQLTSQDIRRALHIDTDKVEIINRKITEHLAKSSQYKNYVNGHYGNYSGESPFAELARILSLSDVTISVEDKESFKGPLPYSKAFTINGRQINFKKDLLTKKAQKIILSMGLTNSSYHDVNTIFCSEADVFTIFYLYQKDISQVRSFKIEGRQPYVKFEDQIFIYTIESFSDLSSILLKEKPGTITFIDGRAYMYSSYGDNQNPITMYPNSLTIAGINPENYGWYESAQELKKKLGIAGYCGVNPLENVVRSKAPVFFYKNIMFNPGGTKYHEL